MQTPSSVPLLSEAFAHHQRGELEQAVRLYRAILAAEPDNADALHLLGLATFRQGQSSQGIELIERAIARMPNVAAFHGNLGEAYRSCRQWRRAAASYQTALRLQPNAADVAFNFGSMLLQLKRPADAIPLFQHALQHQPSYAQAHNGLGNAYRLLGDVTQALAHFRRAVELAPNFGIAQTNLGQMLLDCEQPREALPHCQQAVRLQRTATSLNNLGNAYRQLEQFDSARACYNEALRHAPNTAIIHDNLGRVFYEEGRYDEAANAFQTALKLAPNTALLHRHLGEAQVGQRNFDEADKHLRIAQQMEPRDPSIRFASAWLYSEQGRLEEAQSAYRGILAEYPNHPVVNQHLGELLIELNRIEEAAACFRAARAGNPKYAPALGQLANILHDKLPAQERADLNQLLAEPALSERDRIHLLYGLAHVCDSGGEFEEAAQHVERANALEYAQRKQRGQEFNIDAHRRFVDGLLRTFTPEFFQRIQGFGLDSERPVFIVGLPRSGTSLLEQILASHSRVFGAGEQRFARDSFEKLGGGSDGRCEMHAFDLLRTIDAGALGAMARTHLQWLDALNRTADRVTDKMPDNYMYVGYLHLQFPKARFLHCRRDPRNVAVSCWITQFRQVPWANSFEDLATRFAQYQRIMEHWRRVLPVPMLEVDYEDMVEDVEAAARRAIAFCGLDWEPACLEFHRTRRPVRTASATQVRQPIYRRSVARWRNYDRAMRPLFSRLEHIFGLSGERGASAPCFPSTRGLTPPARRNNT